MCFQANLEGSLRGKTKTGGTAGKLEREGPKRRNIAELVGYKDSGGECRGKSNFRPCKGPLQLSSCGATQFRHGTRINISVI